MEYNTLYLCCIAEPWIEVAKDLKCRGIHPVYFVHWKADEDKLSEAFGDTCHLQTLEDAWKGVGYPSSLKPSAIDEPTYRNIAWYEINALKMMDRLDPLGNYFSFQERRYFFQNLLGYWLSCVEEFDINLVISPSVPHRVFDYALYVACQIKNIRFLMFQMVPFGSTSLIIEDVDDLGIAFNPAEDISGSFELSAHVAEKISKVKKDYASAIPDYMVKQAKNQELSTKKLVDVAVKPIAKTILFTLFKKRAPDTYWVNKGKMPEISSLSWLGFYAKVFLRSLKVKRLAKEYNALTSETIPAKFVLLALHYQPEETSCPTGGSYADQTNIVKVLVETLPRDVKIVVREHKSQFYTHLESASGRDASFYSRLNSIQPDRVVFTSADTSPFALIDEALATVTISGTIGWESAVRGTPTLVFGRAWYSSMPRVHKVKSKQDIIMRLPKIRDEKGAEMGDQILRFHGWLEQNIVRAKHYKTFLPNTDVDFDESRQNLVEAIHERLLKPTNLAQ